MSHSSAKVAIVFAMGVIGGALGSVVVTSDNRPLTGASGSGNNIFKWQM